MKSDRKRTAFQSALPAYGLMLLALLAASTMTGWRLWGFSWYGYFSWYGPALLFLIGVALPLMLRRNRGMVSLTAADNDEKQSRFWPVAVAVVAVFSGAFVLLSARTHFLGDGYQLLSWLQDSIHHKPWETGTFMVQSRVYEWLGGAGEANARLALQLVSYASGILLLAAMAITAQRLFASGRDRLMFLLGMASGGYMLLFFGYLESYPLFVFAVAVFGAVGLVVTHNSVNRWLILPPLLLAGFFHIFSVALIPAALYVMLRSTKLGDQLDALKSSIKKTIAGVMILTAILAIAYFWNSSYFFRFTIVPILPDRFTVEGYTMFSGKHLLDYVNHLFQLLPGLPLLIVLWLKLPTKDIWQRPDYRFLLLLVIPSLALVFIFNPGLGMARDWDLFSFVGVPLVLLCFRFLLDSRNRLKGYAGATVLAISLGGLLLIPRVATQVMPDKSIALFDAYSGLDTIRNGTGRFILLQYLEKQGRTLEAEQRRLQNEQLSRHEVWDQEGQELLRAGAVDQAVGRFHQAVEYAPSYANSWTNLGLCFIERRQWDSALTYLAIADAMGPFNSATYDAMGQVYLFQQDYARGEEYCLEAARLDKENFTARGNLLRLYQMQQRQEDFENLLLEMAWLREVPMEYVARAAALHLRRGEFEEAGRAFLRAVSLGLDSNVVYDLQDQYPALRVLE